MLLGSNGKPAVGDFTALLTEVCSLTIMNKTDSWLK
jgi:hypothetical protein